jgi:hypothetical protein
MRLQTLKIAAGDEPKVLSETPWHDNSSLGGAYRDRLKQYLGGFFERDESGIQPKPELTNNPDKPIPDAIRLLDDHGVVLETYSLRELRQEMGHTITHPSGD